MFQQGLVVIVVICIEGSLITEKRGRFHYATIKIMPPPFTIPPLCLCLPVWCTWNTFNEMKAVSKLFKFKSVGNLCNGNPCKAGQLNISWKNSPIRAGKKTANGWCTNNQNSWKTAFGSKFSWPYPILSPSHSLMCLWIRLFSVVFLFMLVSFGCFSVCFSAWIGLFFQLIFSCPVLQDSPCTRWFRPSKIFTE